MASKRKKKAAIKEAVTTVVVMRLYIAGRAPNSVKAIANLEAICRQHLKDSYKLEIVDVCEHPRRALDDGILVTPSLAKLSPTPGANVIGNLSDTSSVLAALGVTTDAGDMIDAAGATDPLLAPDKAAACIQGLAAPVGHRFRRARGIRCGRDRCGHGSQQRQCPAAARGANRTARLESHRAQRTRCIARRGLRPRHDG